MTTPVRALTISGSLRAGSYNTALLRAFEDLAPADLLQIRRFDLRPLPFYDGDVEAAGAPDTVRALWDAVREAELLVLATPEYNHSVPGVLKNALDWASRARPSVLAGKPVAILGASQGTVGTARAQVHLREILAANGAWVLTGTEVLVARAQDRFDASGQLTDDATRGFLSTFVQRAAAWGARAR